MAVYTLTNKDVSEDPQYLSLLPGDIISCPYSGAQRSCILPSGVYKLACWGAQGGNAYTKKAGGYGGYSEGILTLTDFQTSVYLTAGGQGITDSGQYSSTAIIPGGFNGGGSGVAWTGTTHNGASGGGGSDIRIGGTGYEYRIIVAGGGGGASDNANGGVGGGTSGGAGSMNGGSSTSGNGFGAAAAASYTGGECGGGGGGWYAGYGGSAENYSGGGGSGYVYTSSTHSQHPYYNNLGSKYFLTNASTIDGNSNVPLKNTQDGYFLNYTVGSSGNGYVQIICLSISWPYWQGGVKDMSVNETALYEGTSDRTSYSNIYLIPGKYRLECWGAQGGGFNSTSNNANAGVGGKGGYTAGTLTVKNNTTLFVLPGSVGKCGYGSYQGGGLGGGGTGFGSSESEPGAGGGGASIIRLGDYSSNQATIMVAGGGGGGGEDATDTGGVGGGVNGGSTGYAGGTQTYPGNNTNGGGHFTGNSTGFADGGAGGGGWYGGGSVYSTTAETDGNGGGGGSGFVYTAPNSLITLPSQYYLTDTVLLDGNQTFLSPNGEIETGHTGYGAIKVTLLKNAFMLPKINSSTWASDTEVFIKINSTTWKPVDSVYIKTSDGWMEGG